MSKKFNKVKEYYESGRWTKSMVYDAVTNPARAPWITAEEYELITGEPYVPVNE